MGFTYDENVQAAVFANRRRREQITFIIFLITLIVLIVIAYIAYRIIEIRRAALKAQGAIPVD